MRHETRGLEVFWGIFGASWDVLGRLGTSWECLGASRGRLWGVLCASGGILGASWGHLGASWGHLGTSRMRLRGVFGASWSVLRASLGRLGDVLGRPGSVLCLILRNVAAFWKHVFVEAYFRTIVDGICFQKSNPESSKIIKFYLQNNMFLLSAYFDLRSRLNGNCVSI